MIRGAPTTSQLKSIAVIVYCLLLATTPAVIGKSVLNSAPARSNAYAVTHDDRASRPVQPANPSAPTPAPTPRPGTSTRRLAANGPPSPVSHIFLIVMENHEFGSVIGKPGAPYVNSLAQRYGLATSYFAVSHPSLPNYLAMTGGGTFGISSDCTTCFVNSTNIADQLESSGRTWKAYMEDMPGPCFRGTSSGKYALRHNPFMYYTDIRNNVARCATHVVPFTQLSADLSQNRVPNFVWITPNLCHDMHDCPVSAGDAWLKSIVPGILTSAAFQRGGVLFITWDEGSTGIGGGGHVATIIATPNSSAGYRTALPENHYGLLRTIEALWGLPALGAASSKPPIPVPLHR